MRSDMKQSSLMNDPTNGPASPAQAGLVQAGAVQAGTEDDAQLARRTAAGDHAAFDRIMRRYNQRLYRLAVGVLGDASEAEDVLQESYVRAYYAIGGFAGSGSLGAWLARIVRNEAIDRVRARDHRRVRIMLAADLVRADAEGDELASDHAGDQDVSDDNNTRSDPQAATEIAEIRQTLERAIERLPDPFRSAFMLREVEGLSVEEAAEYLGIPAATVKTRDYRARALLRSYLRESIDTTLPQTFAFLSTRCDTLVERVLHRLRQ
jgi:RNA polymerase sigma-70 factor (ECF subfamily)